MNSDNFDRSIKFVLKWEGVYVNDSNDPGGETKFGISKRAFAMLDIKSLTEEEARTIYRTQYWEKAACDKLEWPMCLVVFDTAVNCGVARAIEWRSSLSAPQLVADYMFARLAHYAKLAARQPQSLRGWTNRVIDLWQTAKGL